MHVVLGCDAPGMMRVSGSIGAPAPRCGSAAWPSVVPWGPSARDPTLAVRRRRRHASPGYGWARRRDPSLPPLRCAGLSWTRCLEIAYGSSNCRPMRVAGFSRGVGRRPVTPAAQGPSCRVLGTRHQRGLALSGRPLVFSPDAPAGASAVGRPCDSAHPLWNPRSCSAAHAASQRWAVGDPFRLSAE